MRGWWNGRHPLPVAALKKPDQKRKAELADFDAVGGGSQVQRAAHARRITLEEEFLQETVQQAKEYVMETDAFIDRLSRLDVDACGELTNTFSDEFRTGRDIRDLIPVLRHEDPEVVIAGAWIASEVVDQRRGREIYGDLIALLGHSDPGVRFEAVAAVAQLLEPGEDEIVRSLVNCVVDDDMRVTLRAFRYLYLLPDSVFRGSRDANIRLLTESAQRDGIREAINSDSVSVRRLAMAAAMRNYGDDGAFIQELIHSFDDSIAEWLGTMPRAKRPV